MEIKNTTVYAKKKLEKYVRYHFFGNNFVSITLIVCSAIVFPSVILQAIFGTVPKAVIGFTLFLFAFDILHPLLGFVFLPKMYIKKSKTVGATIEYSFSDEQFTMHAANDHLDETSTVKYTMLLKVLKNKDDIYLYIGPNQAFILDLSGSEENDKLRFKKLIKSKVKKVKWN